MIHRSLKTPTEHLSNLALALNAGDVGINVEGKNHSIRNCRLTGGQHGVRLFGGTENILVENLVHADPNAGHGLYISAGDSKLPNRGAKIINPQITINKGRNGAHPVRIYAAEELLWVGGTLTHYGSFPGAAITFRQMKDSWLYSGVTLGRPVGTGADKKTEEEGYLVTNNTWVGWTFDMNDPAHIPDSPSIAPFVFGSGVSDNTFIECKFIQRHPKKAVIRVEAAWRTRPAAQNNTLLRCKLYGGSKVADGGNLPGVTYSSSTWNDNAIQ